MFEQSHSTQSVLHWVSRKAVLNQPPGPLPKSPARRRSTSIVLSHFKLSPTFCLDYSISHSYYVFIVYIFRLSILCTIFGAIANCFRTKLCPRLSKIWRKIWCSRRSPFEQFVFLTVKCFNNNFFFVWFVFKSKLSTILNQLIHFGREQCCFFKNFTNATNPNSIF